MKYIIILADVDSDDPQTPVKEYDQAPLIPAVGDAVKLFGSNIDGKVIERRFVYELHEVRVILRIKMTYGPEF